MKRGGVVGVAGLAALMLLAATGFNCAVEDGRPVALQAVGAVGPGSVLTLNTAVGPMQLTVDSQMNPGAIPLIECKMLILPMQA